MIIEFLGRHGEVLKSVTAPRLCVSISIRNHENHFPNQPTLPNWHARKKISDLPRTPAEAAVMHGPAIGNASLEAD
jgi:hypothetical protein